MVGNRKIVKNRSGREVGREWTTVREDQQGKITKEKHRKKPET